MFGSPRNPVSAYASVSLETSVAAANPHQLIVLLLEGAKLAILSAKGHMVQGNIVEKGSAISKAIDIISNGLKASLDQEAGGDIAIKLDALYEYMTQRLLWANIKNDPAALDEVSQLLGEILETWRQIAPGSEQAA